MPGIEHYLTFIVSGIILNITPGQDTLYILSRSIAQGRKAGIASSLGIATGSLFHTLFAAFGLSAILSTSPLLFDIIKYAGAAYLVFLGVQLIIKHSTGKNETIPLATHDSMTGLYKKGIFTNLLNPKVALFFIAFLPQFIISDQPYGALPFLILGCTFIITGTLWCMFLAACASAVSARLRAHPRYFSLLNKICGCIFIALGLKLIFQKK